MNSSILDSIKKLLGIDSECTDFDSDIIIHINSTFTILSQLGIGPRCGFYISDNSSIWENYIEGANIELVKSYVYLKVRMIFDPPTNGALIESYEKLIRESECRLNYIAESMEEEVNGNGV